MKLVHFFKYKLDGERYYIGRDMTEVHKNLGITDEMFDRACQILTASFTKMKPTTSVLREFVKRITAMRSEISFPPPVSS